MIASHVRKIFPKPTLGVAVSGEVGAKRRLSPTKPINPTALLTIVLPETQVTLYTEDMGYTFK